MYSLFEVVSVSAVVRFVRKTTTDVIGRYDPIRRTQIGKEPPVHKRPRRIAMQHDDWGAMPLIDIVLAKPGMVVEMTLKGEKWAK